MEKSREEQMKVGGEKGKIEEGLPTDTSPYTQYKDVEDYKKKGYGTEGHLQPQPGRGPAASTDAPTAAGGGASSEAQHSTATDVINRQGVP